MPVAADVVVPPGMTDQGMAAVEVYHPPKRGYGVRRAGDELPAGAVLARAGAYVTPRWSRSSRPPASGTSSCGRAPASW